MQRSNQSPMSKVESVNNFSTFDIARVKIHRLTRARNGMRLAITSIAQEPMLKISTIESSSYCRLVVEGKLIAPWAAELKTACERAKAELGGRKLIVDIRNLPTIDHDGEDILFELMNDGVRVRGCGVFTKHILKQLAQRKRRNHREATS
jgi:anti-anti-sigma regulatory factor